MTGQNALVHKTRCKIPTRRCQAPGLRVCRVDQAPNLPVGVVPRHLDRYAGAVYPSDVGRALSASQLGKAARLLDQALSLLGNAQL